MKRFQFAFWFLTALRICTAQETNAPTGPYIYSTEVSEKSATVNVEIPIQNDRVSNEEVDVSVQILDHDGKVVSTGQVAPVMKIASTALVKANIAVNIANPKLWQPDFPYLYRAKISLSVAGHFELVY